MLGEARQRLEDAHVVLVVGAQLEAIALRDDERDLEDVDRVEAEAFAVERRLGIDRLGSDVEVQRLDQKRGDFALQIGVGEGHSCDRARPYRKRSIESIKGLRATPIRRVHPRP